MISKRQGVSCGSMLRARFLGAIISAAIVAFLLIGGSAADARGRGATASGPIFAWILLDAETGQVLSEHNADALTYPASLAKMMTLYLTFEALNDGRLRLDQLFRVSAEAASRSPSKLGLTPGDAVPVRDLILALVTKSANDAASVLAENLAGSEPEFARRMTLKARQLGMQHTWYQNASGLPNPNQRTTARDIARLSLALYHQFPREYRYFSIREFDFRGDDVRSHNRLLDWYAGADGIKTGFINASGFNLAASAVRNGRRLVGVIMGGQSARGRDLQMASLLDQGFAALNVRPAQPGAEALVAAAPAVSPRAASAVSAAAAVQPVVHTAVAVARASAAANAGEGDREETQQLKSSSLRKVASAALRRLAPVSKAEAAPAVKTESAADEWSIQLGAFRDQAAARQAIKRVAGLAIAKGKPQQVLTPAKSDRTKLYRARLSRFSEKSAQAACAELKKRKLDCSVVRPAAVKLAHS